MTTGRKMRAKAFRPTCDCNPVMSSGSTSTLLTTVTPSPFYASHDDNPTAKSVCTQPADIYSIYSTEIRKMQIALLDSVLVLEFGDKKAELPEGYVVDWCPARKFTRTVNQFID